MATLELTFINASGEGELTADLPDNMRCEQIVQSLITEHFITALSDGARSYTLTVKGGNTIQEGQTLAQAGVHTGDKIRVNVTQRGGSDTAKGSARYE